MTIERQGNSVSRDIDRGYHRLILAVTLIVAAGEAHEVPCAC
jgi:hypothetical protein